MSQTVILQAKQAKLRSHLYQSKFVTAEQTDETGASILNLDCQKLNCTGFWLRKTFSWGNWKSVAQRPERQLASRAGDQCPLSAQQLARHCKMLCYPHMLGNIALLRLRKLWRSQWLGMNLVITATATTLGVEAVGG